MSFGGIAYIRDVADWDTHDAWASLRSLQFDIAEARYGSHGIRLPGYTPSAGFSDEEWESERAGMLYVAMNNDIISTGDVEYWWRVLDRMEAILIKAGRNY